MKKTRYEFMKKTSFVHARQQEVGGFLMGFNEPDGSHQTCSPEEAADKWIIVQQIADYSNLRQIGRAHV